jgi:hypothetical protein
MSFDIKQGSKAELKQALKYAWELDIMSSSIENQKKDEELRRSVDNSRLFF